MSTFARRRPDADDDAYKSESFFSKLTNLDNWWTDQKLTVREREHIAHPRCHLGVHHRLVHVDASVEMMPMMHMHLHQWYQCDQHNLHIQRTILINKREYWSVARLGGFYEWQHQTG